jgi:hypothetical protein
MCTDTVLGLMKSASAMSRFDAPLLTPIEDLALAPRQPVLGSRSRGVEAGSQADVGHQGGQRRRAKLFCDRCRTL